MQIFTDEKGDVGGLKVAVDNALGEGKAKSLLILSCDENGYTPELIDPILKDIPVPILGGLFPVVLHGTHTLKKGSVVVALDQCPEVYSVPEMDDPDVDFEDVLDELVGDDGDCNTLMVFVDGLSPGNARFVDALYAIFGLEINYIGGGAGSLSLRQKTCVLTNDGLKEHCAVLGAFPTLSGIGVSHGWTSISGPYQVTESKGNVIKSLDWRHAFDVYKEIVEEHSGTQFVALPFFDIAKAYPFGIAKMGAERIVRDPVTLDGDRNIVCVVDVPQGAYVDIMHGDEKALIEAAGSALLRAKDNFPKESKPALGLVMDCLSRVLFLGDNFSKELGAVIPGDIQTVGACSLGEIANSGNDYLEMYNKTAVVALLED